MTAANAVTGLKPPKHIKCKTAKHPDGKHIHLRLVQQVLWSIIGAAVGAFMVVSIYYGIFEVHWTIAGHTILNLKHSWDYLFTAKNGQPASWWVPGRHDYRNCYEAVFATLFIKSILGGKKKHWDKRVPVWRVATAPLLIFVVAFPIITAGIWLFDIRNGSSTLPYQVLVYQSYFVGFIAAQIVHRFYMPVANTVQLFFVEEVLSLKKRPRWPLPPTIRERYAWMEQAGIEPKIHARATRVALFGLAAILLWFAVFGAGVKYGWWLPTHVTIG